LGSGVSPASPEGPKGGLLLAGGTADAVQASSLGAQSVTLNGVANPSNDLSNAPGHPFSTGSGPSFAYAFTPNSITLLTLHTTVLTPTHWLFLPLLRR